MAEPPGNGRGERWCVLLLSSRMSRLFEGTRERVEEIVDRRDDVRGRHHQGGWSQPGYERHIEKEIEDHVRGTCELLYERWRQEPFEHLLLGVPQELRPRVERGLHADLRARLEGHFEIDVERASAEDVRHRARPLMEEQESRREREALARLAESLAPGGHAATGLDETLQLLGEGRVATLLVAHGYAAPGASCPACERLWPGEGNAGACPLDGAPLSAQEDVVKLAVKHAAADSVELLVVRQHAPELERHGSIAALLRY